MMEFSPEWLPEKNIDFENFKAAWESTGGGDAPNNNVSLARFYAHEVKHLMPELRSERLTSLGIDTVWLTFPVTNGVVNPMNQFKVKKGYGERKNRVLFQYATGERVEGVAAFYRVQGVHIEIMPSSRRGSYIGQGSLYGVIKFSVEGMNGRGDNLLPCDRSATEDVFANVQRIVEEAGLNVNVLELSVCRLDLNCNLVLDEPVEVYSGVWNRIDVARMKDKWHFDSGKTGFLIKNGRHEFNGYDLRARRKKNCLPVQHLPSTLFRIEWRLRRSVKNRGFGINNLSDVLAKWDALPVMLTDSLRKNLFPIDPANLKGKERKNGLSPTQAQIRNIIRWCCKNGFKAPTKRRLREAVREGGAQGFAEILMLTVGLNREAKKHLQTATRNIRAAIKEEELLSDPVLARRYAEVRDKALWIKLCPSLTPLPIWIASDFNRLDSWSRDLSNLYSFSLFTQYGGLDSHPV